MGGNKKEKDCRVTEEQLNSAMNKLRACSKAYEVTARMMLKIRGERKKKKPNGSLVDSSSVCVRFLSDLSG